MSTLAEWIERHRRELREERAPPAGPPVFLPSDKEEAIVPNAAGQARWGTQILPRNSEKLKRLADDRVDRLMALQPLVSDAAEVLELEKSDRNPAPHLCIGRAKRNDVVVLDGTISSLHAIIELEGTRAFLTDQNSSNGTFVNQEFLRAGERRLLDSGDCVRLGQCVFYFLTHERWLMFLGLRIVKSQGS